jgi:hypothetical protein
MTHQELVGLVESEIAEREATMSESGDGEYDCTKEIEELKSILDCVVSMKDMNYTQYEWLVGLVQTNCECED